MKNRLFDIKKCIPLFGIILCLMSVSIFPSICSNEQHLNLPINLSKTLYVGGSGANNYSYIQLAINDADEGDTVYVFAYSSPYYGNLIVNKTINLIGEDKTTTELIGVFGKDVVNVIADSVFISGFGISNGGTDIEDAGIGIKSKNCIITDNYFFTNSMNGLYLGPSARNNKISENIFESNGYYGIYLNSSNQNTIFNNNFEFHSGTNSAGIFINSSSSYNYIVNNSIKNNNHGIRIDSFSNNNLIDGNSIRENDINGIYVFTLGSDIMTSNQILDNDISNNGGNGIELSISTFSIISNNTISYNGYNGVYLQFYAINNTISNNLITNNIKNGIQLTQAVNTTVFNNTIIENDLNGVLLDLLGSNFIESNYIQANNNHGIIITSYISNEENRILDNNINSNDICGIYLDEDSSNNDISNNIITKNNIGMYLKEADNNFIINNTIIGNPSEGIELCQNSDNNQILENSIWSSNNGLLINDDSKQNNIVSNNITYNNQGISLSLSDSNIIYNNYFENNINAIDDGINVWNNAKNPGDNIIDGEWIGGNYWNDYYGVDTDDDGLGNTNLPYNCNGNIIIGGDNLPLVKDCGIPYFIRPSNYLYLLDIEFFETIFPIIVGPITLQIEIREGEDCYSMVEFYMNDIYLGSDSSYPYEYECTMQGFGPRLFKAFVYDYNGFAITLELAVIKIF